MGAKAACALASAPKLMSFRSSDPSLEAAPLYAAALEVRRKEHEVKRHTFSSGPSGSDSEIATSLRFNGACGPSRFSSSFRGFAGRRNIVEAI